MKLNLTIFLLIISSNANFVECYYSLKSILIKTRSTKSDCLKGSLIANFHDMKGQFYFSHRKFNHTVTDKLCKILGHDFMNSKSITKYPIRKKRCIDFDENYFLRNSTFKMY